MNCFKQWLYFKLFWNDVRWGAQLTREKTYFFNGSIPSGNKIVIASLGSMAWLPGHREIEFVYYPATMPMRKGDSVVLTYSLKIPPMKLRIPTLK